MKKIMILSISGLFLFVSSALINHFLSISFKANKISKEIHGNLAKIFEHNGMIVDITDCLKTEWDSIYVFGHYCDSLKISCTIPPHYGIQGNGYSNCIVILKSGKVSYIDYIHYDGFTNPPVDFFIDNCNDSYLITHKDNCKFIVWNDDRYFRLFPAEEYAMKPDTFFLHNLNIAVDDRLFIEKFSAFWDGDISLKELFK